MVNKRLYQSILRGQYFIKSKQEQLQNAFKDVLRIKDMLLEIPG